MRGYWLDLDPSEVPSVGGHMLVMLSTPVSISDGYGIKAD